MIPYNFGIQLKPTIQFCGCFASCPIIKTSTFLYRMQCREALSTLILLIMSVSAQEESAGDSGYLYPKPSSSFVVPSRTYLPPAIPSGTNRIITKLSIMTKKPSSLQKMDSSNSSTPTSESSDLTTPNPSYSDTTTPNPSYYDTTTPNSQTSELSTPISQPSDLTMSDPPSSTPKMPTTLASEPSTSNPLFSESSTPISPFTESELELTTTEIPTDVTPTASQSTTIPTQDSGLKNNSSSKSNQMLRQDSDSDQAHKSVEPYSFGYSVKDKETGNDYSHQAESKDGVVNGEYRTLLPDGRTQIVKYMADWKNGYRAKVTYEGREASYPKSYKKKIGSSRNRSDSIEVRSSD